MKTELPIVVSHIDLDGIVSYLAVCWKYDNKLRLVGTTPMKLEKEIEKYLPLIEQGYPFYFTDLDVSKIGSLIDKPNVTIIDHHKTNIYPFKNAKVKIVNYSSCAKLIYEEHLKEKNLSTARKTLIALADDWDSNSKNIHLSEDLNIVYHNTNNKIESFITDYYDGFVPFDKFKKNIIFLYKKNRDEYIKQLNPFFGNISFEDELVKVGAVFCNSYVAECCDYLFQKFDVDVSIAVMVEQQRIAVRRSSKNNTVDVSKFVQRIANGGGHAAAAGGNLTEEFIEFTKMLKPLE
jgi:oligoribonuclease NrnB/cAMP/cGMP phosphodiesterase (DHH superfamily)